MVLRLWDLGFGGLEVQSLGLRYFMARGLGVKDFNVFELRTVGCKDLTQF